MRRVAQVRDEHYQLLRGLFRGADDLDGASSARMHSVVLDPHAYAVGKPVEALKLDGVQVRAVRRPGMRKRLELADAGALQAGDVVVLLGLPEALAAAEDRLRRG
jgi:CPA2 family monovalent cation:H+ antiporter-2